MMTNLFAVALIAASTILSGSALARSSHGVTGAAETGAWVGESGTASYYGSAFNGRLSADGGRFDQMALTAAHPWLPFGTKVRVTLAGTDRTVVVTITDRLYSKRRIVDLSLAAARRIGIVHQGLGKVILLPA
jgi:rare lipoprotein A